MASLFSVRILVVLGQTAELGEPAEGALDDPALGQDGKAMLVHIAAFDHLQVQSTAGQQLLDPGHQGSGVTSIDEDAAQPAEAFQEHRQNQFGSVAVLEGRRMHHHVQDQTQRIHQEVSFASQNLLARIVAAHSSVVRYFNALRIEDRSGRGFFFPLRRRTWSRRVSWILCQRPVAPPDHEVVIDDPPRRQIVRQQAPGASAAHHVEDGIEDGSSWRSVAVVQRALVPE